MAEDAMSRLSRTNAKRAKTVDVDKVGKLLRILSSDKEGEVIAGVAALRRVLEAGNLDLHHLADAAVAGLKPRKPARASWEPPAPDLQN
jgi:hypothetical protein